MLNCIEFEERLQELLDERREPAADGLLVEHARGCASCSQWLSSLQSIVAASDYMGTVAGPRHERHVAPCWRRESAMGGDACRRRRSGEGCQGDDGDGVELSSGDSSAREDAACQSRWLTAGESREQDELREPGVGWRRGIAVWRALAVALCISGVVSGLEQAARWWEKPLPVTAGKAAVMTRPPAAAAVMDVVVYDPLFVWPKRAMQVAGQLPPPTSLGWDVRSWVEPTNWVEPVAEQLVTERLTELRSEPWQFVEGFTTGMRPLAESMSAALEDWMDAWAAPRKEEGVRQPPADGEWMDWRWDLIA